MTYGTMSYTQIKQAECSDRMGRVRAWYWGLSEIDRQMIVISPLLGAAAATVFLLAVTFGM